MITSTIARLAILAAVTGFALHHAASSDEMRPAADPCAPEQTIANESGTILLFEEFGGVQPCADCSGVETALRLYADVSSGRSAGYELVQICPEAGEGHRRFQHTGQWTIRRGVPTDPQATVYQIEIGESDGMRSFVLASDELHMLDRLQRELPPQLPHSLHRTAPVGEAITLRETQSGEKIQVKPGQRIAVLFNSNRASGYQWMLIGAGAVKTALGDPVYVPSAVKAIGAPGVESWWFIAKHRGTQQLRFEYHRSWERDIPPAKCARFEILVR